MLGSNADVKIDLNNSAAPDNVSEASTFHHKREMFGIVRCRGYYDAIFSCENGTTVLKFY